jgi:signal transduction histidine kinase
MMPGLGGFETARRLKKRAGEEFLPVVLVTSLADAGSRATGFETGADEYLTKPVSSAELHARIRGLLALRAKDLAQARRNRALLELDRFKTEMSSLLVHDLRGLAAVILANHDFLVESVRGSKDDLALESLEDSRVAAERMLHLLGNLLDTTRIEEQRLQLRRAPVAVRELLESIVRPRRLSLRMRELTAEVGADEALRVRADRDLLGRVIENIVENAVRYTPRNGRIALTAEKSADHVRIRIGNTGRPIPAASRQVLFDKYAQLSSDHGRMNLGLGLYFCRLAVEAHGGRIWIEETPELATVFVLELGA